MLGSLFGGGGRMRPTSDKSIGSGIWSRSVARSTIGTWRKCNRCSGMR